MLKAGRKEGQQGSSEQLDSIKNFEWGIQIEKPICRHLKSKTRLSKDTVSFGEGKR